ncbi:hypothetical protein [Microvirga massiliensis]|uniref:hypothetical protein n=1 Tax=Microvirga massiliensis TaxID=1033741 RepID=UPI00062B76EE|nr:hypothetical protein [Microvirga massiliensis]
MAAYRASGAEIFLPYLLLLKAVAQLENSQTVEAALELVKEALLIANRTGERCFEAELYRLRGECLLYLPSQNRAEPEASFVRALDVARRQAAKLWELRAASSLARLWQNSGKCNEARELLAPVYGWFTEGFDTADLKDAKSLLDQLG